MNRLTEFSDLDGDTSPRVLQQLVERMGRAQWLGDKVQMVTKEEIFLHFSDRGAVEMRKLGESVRPFASLKFGGEGKPIPKSSDSLIAAFFSGANGTDVAVFTLRMQAAISALSPPQMSADEISGLARVAFSYARDREK